ncbi:hypothetical protein DPMN_007913 [Dreissena polymorpha]|uniref:Uncharacterized protein n=1 Tax=Dreissena polymorpha TaxID=45954 RepID=A0A9D4MX25_DREPO|nr:hypothetical protein DPMN_007913 [Dreissena polymorpha]
MFYESDDVKLFAAKIHGRGDGKYKGGNITPRGALDGPYQKPAASSNIATQWAETQLPLRRTGPCFACDEPGHRKGAAGCSANSSNNR